MEFYEDEEYDRDPEETDSDENTSNVLTVTFDLDKWLHGDTVLDRIEGRLVDGLIRKYEKEVLSTIETSVSDLVHEKVAERIDDVVKKKLNQPVIKRNWEGEIESETPMLEYLSDQFTKHLLTKERGWDKKPRFEQWVSKNVIDGLDKLVQETLVSLRQEAESAVRGKVQELLADYISKHWKPYPLPPLLKDSDKK